MITRTRIKLGLVALSAVAMTGCSLLQPQQAPVVAPPAAQAPAPGQASSGGGGAGLGPRSPEGGYYPQSLQVGQIPGLGAVIVDGQGYTLYRFDNDSSHPPQSHCEGTCLAQWPPALANQGTTYSNIDPSLLGTVQRPDGSYQIAAAGWSLYRYLGDVAPGQANGQGIGNVWFAAAPDGSRAGGGRSSR